MANALLDALGWVGESLDKPGRAVRGLLGGRPEEAMAAIPFSDTFGLTDPGNRVSGGDLLRQWGADPGDDLGGTLAGMGVEMATDPLMFAGGAIGGLLGRRAGAAAMARGPQYETSMDDLARIMGRESGGVRPPPSPVTSDIPDLATLGDDVLDVGAARTPAGPSPSGFEDMSGYHFDKIARSPSAADILREIPPNATLLGTGAEGVAFRGPAGNVVRVGTVGTGERGIGRAIDDEVLQATRAVDFPGPSDYGRDTLMRVERTPFAASAGDEAVMTPDVLDGLTQRLSGRNIDFWDNHAGNAGMVGGRPMVIDPGAVMTLGDEGAALSSFQPVAFGTREASPLMSRLIDLGGGNEAVRAAIEAGRLDPGMMYSLARLGGMGGAGLGVAGRTLEGF